MNYAMVGCALMFHALWVWVTGNFIVSIMMVVLSLWKLVELIVWVGGHFRIVIK